MAMPTPIDTASFDPHTLAEYNKFLTIIETTDYEPVPGDEPPVPLGGHHHTPGIYTGPNGQQLRDAFSTTFDNLRMNADTRLTVMNQLFAIAEDSPT